MSTVAIPPAVRIDPVQVFQWSPQPLAQDLINALAADFLARCPGAAALARRMTAQTGTRFNDWIDHLQAPRSTGVGSRLLDVGFKSSQAVGAAECFVHSGGLFPQVLLSQGHLTRIFLKVDSVTDFLSANQVGEDHPLEGEPLAQLRRARVCTGTDTELWVIERHGYRGYEVPEADPVRSIRAQRHLESFRRRKRNCGTDEQGFAHLNELVDAAAADLGPDWACDVFFTAERDYWQRRNRAAQVQKARQDKLGLGWGNHDHHTYRSSREHFGRMISLWEKLGFKSRERFYAGAEAGWGAQVMDQPVTGITTFNDVDMSPEELMGDFAHSPLPPRQRVGTVGLWCALHGEAVLQAGMHHLECQFDWYALAEQLEAIAGVKTMAPFTTLPYLRQAFTEGETWAVDPQRIDALLSKGLITPEQADQFRLHGAIGSHLENLERNDGFKGFDQKGVSDIIAKTDARRQGAARATA
jgi:hypothetical protein